MATVLVGAVLIVICIFSIRSYCKKLSGGGCCGGADAPKRTRVEDKNKSHYPECLVLQIDGMSCGNCAIRVENALNELPGVWATVSLDKKEALVRMKEPLDPAVLKDAVRRAGYSAAVQENG